MCDSKCSLDTGLPVIWNLRSMALVFALVLAIVL